ncbi:Gfo/Idh/MocA family oxidoreductase [bacterium]|nr:Gfo/Idh/MocA family oxidoreductase [bacterium]
MDKLRVGVIGVGGRGTLSNNWLHSKRAVIVGGADVSEKQLAGFRERVGENVFTTTDYRELLDRGGIDAIMVTSPDFVHEEHALAAISAGKHVYLEKPMAITIDGCDRIINAQKSAGVKLMVGFNMRCMPMFRMMKGIVDSGTIGEVKAVWVRHFVGYGSQFYYHDWHGNRANTTSLLLQKGSHDIDIIHWISGGYTKRVAAFGDLDFFGGDKPNDLRCPECDENSTCTEAVLAGLTQCAYRKEIDVEDNNVMIMRLDNGVKASYLQCHFTPDYHRNYVFIGTEGRMENSEPEGKVWVKTRRANTWRDYSDQTYEMKPITGDHGGADPVITDMFLDMVLDGKDPVATAVDGRMSVAAGVCGAESMRNGGMPVDVPAVSLK